MESSIALLIGVGCIPIITSVVLHILFKSKLFSKVSEKVKRIIAGVVFGIIAILGTEYGVPFNGATMNARDAAPLCAALIFGGEAGVIAGFIGGLERWFSVYWGVGAYTRVACSISTFVVGVVGAFIRKYMFDDKIPSPGYALAVGLNCEIFHMLMVFVTNMNDPITAFNVVKACTVPMVLINSLSVTFATFLISKFEKNNTYTDKDKQVTLSQKFQKALLILVVGALLVTEIFTYIIQTNIALNDTKNLISLNIEDVVNSVDNISDKNLLLITKDIGSRITDKTTDAELSMIAKRYDVAEINIVDKNGYIIKSTNSDFIGWDMSSGKQSSEFLSLNKDKSEFVQPYQLITFDGETYRKYAGVKLTSGFIQVGIDASQFQEELSKDVEDSAEDRHIGKAGGLIIANSKSTIVSDSRKMYGFPLETVCIVDDGTKKENTIYRGKVYGEDSYYMFMKAEGYTIVGFIPKADADLSKELSIYLNFFLETLTFGVLFVLIYFLIKNGIVNNILKINKSLKKITEGDLTERVEVYSTEEFSSLSSGINATVQSMNNLIDEANNRMNAELQYAKDIQRSALPGIFPPFPDRDEFDIYALMRPAKEVGGDFYDFYFVDNDTLAIVVADVSGKGIPAALFMMRSKSIIKSYAEAGIAPADIFTNANYNLCEGNDTGMFVTSWIGFVNLTTGVVKFANAGHNPPVIRRKDGSFEYLKSKVGFVLAGMDGISYKEQETTLNPGDEIFLYTDGVVEATNAETILFGDDRLKDSLNRHYKEDVQTMCESVLKDVDDFVGEAPQFDDITMLSLKIKEKK